METAQQPHIALFPSAGMGHVTPFLRLAAMLSSRQCTVTLITTQPVVSAAESNHISHFLSTHPQIKHLQFHLLPFHESDRTTDDPFFLQFEAVRRSVHLLHPLLLDSSPPLSAIFSDFAVAANVGKVSMDLRIPNYVVSTTSANFFALIASLPLLTYEGNAKLSIGCGNVTIAGLGLLPESSIPPPFFNPNHLFTRITVSNSQYLPEAKGILLNNFQWFEAETLSALNNGSVLRNLPPVLPIGPLQPYEQEKDQELPWIDEQPAQSVVYISFGSRTAMSKEQIKELGDGLERSNCRFLWVLKTSKVDTDDKEEITELLGSSFLKRTKNKGVVVQGWVNQEEVLAHPAIGGFVNHCGWNSVTEAALRGMPMLAWPQHGDQRVNAEVVAKAGLGIWVKDWGWGVGRLVEGEEIGKRIGELMRDEELRARAGKVGEEARKAWGFGGSSEKALMEIIEGLK
ncbi:UDP-glycosyltransferase 708G1-like [Malania oleifera]|uniref:UDP-glycosyltransferase 708G1-like n=1 Tax=Malania oleifera TaxID=397392 RepID=UPI0025ADB9A3|nr:UDP-glycosyltransferase 708G1-like [Malania oleifera]